MDDARHEDVVPQTSVFRSNDIGEWPLPALERRVAWCEQAIRSLERAERERSLDEAKDSGSKVLQYFREFAFRQERPPSGGCVGASASHDWTLHKPWPANEDSLFPDYLQEVVHDRQSFFDKVRNRVKHGYHLTIDEQRTLFELASGETITTRKRCQTCDADGEIDPGDPCPACNGKGYRDE